MRVLVVGAGKVGRALATGLRACGASVAVTRARARLRRDYTCDLLVIAAADPFLADVAARVAARIASSGARPGAVVHVAGALGLEPLRPFRSVNVPVGTMHPLLSFVGRTPSFTGATLRVGGDAKAVRAARRVARILGMVPRTLPGLPDAAYHAAAALVANGSVALVSAATDLLVRHGVAPAIAPEMFAVLLRSVAANLLDVGLPNALSGPVRRGDVATVERHLDLWGERADLYRAIVSAQLAMAERIGEASGAALDALRSLSDRPPQNRSKPARRAKIRA